MLGKESVSFVDSPSSKGQKVKGKGGSKGVTVQRHTISPISSKTIDTKMRPLLFKSTTKSGVAGGGNLVPFSCLASEKKKKKRGEEGTVGRAEHRQSIALRFLPCNDTVFAFRASFPPNIFARNGRKQSGDGARCDG